MNTPVKNGLVHSTLRSRPRADIAAARRGAYAAALACSLLSACAPSAIEADAEPPHDVGDSPINVPPASSILSTLRASHPRIMVLPGEMERIERLTETDANAATIRRRIGGHGSWVLAQDIVRRELLGPRLLSVSYAMLDRMQTLGTLHRIAPDPKQSRRAIDEMLAVARFSDWNPSHFLDVAVMTTAMSIGYDWFYDAMSGEERRLVRQAIIDKGLKAGQAQYDQGAFWTTADTNWNLVCNGGMVVGALAVGSDAPSIAGEVLRKALLSMPHALATYSPDGGWNEGRSYWAFATSFLMYAVTSLQSALGKDFGVSGSPGLPRTGFFNLHAIGPTGLSFNFADSDEAGGNGALMAWLGRRYDQPVLRAAGRVHGGLAPLDLFFYDPDADAAIHGTPLDTLFEGTDVAFFRSAWNDPNALYVGFKGGDNGVNHGHLDLGTFVLDAAGQRWAIELGKEDYNIPGGYFNANRWSWYRARTEGQNTLTIDGQNQDLDAKAEIVTFRSEPGKAFAIANLSEGYKTAGVDVFRGIALIEGKSRVLVRDQVDASRPVDVVWGMHTRASVAVNGKAATLTQGGKTMRAQILSPSDARFEVQRVDLAPPQLPSDGVRKLVVRLGRPVEQAAITVVFTPPGAREGTIRPRWLSAWSTSGPVE